MLASGAQFDCPGSGCLTLVTRECHSWPSLFSSSLTVTPPPPHYDTVLLPLPHQRSLAPSEYVGARGPR